MDIGVIGWWNYDNQGDLAMLSALRQGLAPHRVVPIDTGFPAQSDTIYRLNRLDYVILGGGTLIQGQPTAPFDTFNDWAHQLQSPLGVAGLGVDPIHEQYWPAVQVLLDRSEFFYVRDQASRALLRSHLRVEVVPDLTFAYPLQAGGCCADSTEAAPVCGVNLRCASGFDPQPWLKALSMLPVKIRGVPLSSFDVFSEGALLKQLDPATPERFDATVYQRLDLMVGTAFHSILFAVQAGIPVIAIDYAPKVHNFMEDIGFSRYLLTPHEHCRLATLVSEVLADRRAIRDALCIIGSSLHESAQRNVCDVRGRIGRSGLCHRRTGPKVTIAIVISGDAEKDRRTLASCNSQTYENVEVLCVSANPRESAGVRLRHALTQSSGEYLTWVDGGDWFADDAVDCLVSRMEGEPQWDVVYADYYSVSSTGLPLGYHTVPGPEKLYRRDVVGPCYLMRRALLPLLDQKTVDAALIAYSVWLQAKSNKVLTPFHAPLFYSSRPIRSRAFVAKERDARRRWRRSQSLWTRVMWRLIDTELCERLFVQPLVHLLRLFRGRNHDAVHR